MKRKKTLQTNIGVNGLYEYDARLCGSNVHSLVSYGSFSAMLVWSVFITNLNVCYNL